jgi:hypothetical protein
MAEPTRVLISYSHDTPAHAAAVLALADALRAAGVDAHIDQYDPFPKVGWPAWMREKLAWANKIIAVCTPPTGSASSSTTPPASASARAGRGCSPS